MKSPTGVPFPDDWTTSASTSPTASLSASRLAAALGQLDIADLEVDDREQLRRELGRAITELAVAAGRPHLVATGDPLVVQLRALGRLALVAPGATSAAAGRILAAGSSASA